MANLRFSWLTPSIESARKNLRGYTVKRWLLDPRLPVRYLPKRQPKSLPSETTTSTAITAISALMLMTSIPFGLIINKMLDHWQSAR